MKISIKYDKYINHQCPPLTKYQWDTFWSHFYIKSRYKLPFNNEDATIDKIDSINIRVEEAYAGCGNFHFYISINGLPEYHLMQKCYEEPMWSFEGKRNKMHPRCEWLVDFEKHLRIDMGENKAKQHIDNLWFIKKQKKKSVDRIKRIKSEYKKYLELHEKFGHYRK